MSDVVTIPAKESLKFFQEWFNKDVRGNKIKEVFSYDNEYGDSFVSFVNADTITRTKSHKDWLTDNVFKPRRKFVFTTVRLLLSDDDSPANVRLDTFRLPPASITRVTSATYTCVRDKGDGTLESRGDIGGTVVYSDDKHCFVIRSYRSGFSSRHGLYIYSVV